MRPLFLFIAVAIVATSLWCPSKTFAGDTLGFHDEAEFGTVDVSGNVNSESYSAKDLAGYSWDNNVVKFSVRYLNTRTSGVDSARNWDGALRYERVLTELFNIFTSYGLESDVFAGYVQRNNFDLGGKYYLAKSEPTTWTLEAGYRNIATHFPASAPDSTNNAARVYSEFDQTITKTASFRYWIEYIQSLGSSLSGTPGYSVSQDYQFNTEPSISVMLNDVFSVKSAYLFKYKNYIPVGSTATKYLDSVFTTSLVAKF